MGSLVKQAGSPYWYARFTVDGREIWKSTRTANRRDAEAILKAYENAARGRASTDDQFNVLLKMLAALPPTAQDEKRIEYAQRLTRRMLVALPIAQAWEAWLSMPKTTGAATLAGYAAIWRRFAAWISPKVEHLHEVTQLHAKDYASALWRSQVTATTFNNHVKLLRTVFAALREQSGMALNPWAEVKLLEKDTQGRENFTPDELATICSRATGTTRYMLGLGLYTGMRLGDVVTLRWQDIKPDRIEIIPRKTSRKQKKITLPIHAVLAGLLQELKKQGGDSEYLFPAEREAYLKDSGAITKGFQKFLNDCGITTTEDGNGHRRRAIIRKGFHSLRHSFVSLCAANKVPQVAIMDLVGHGSPAMTALYSHADFEQKQSAIDGLPALAFEEPKQIKENV